MPPAGVSQHGSEGGAGGGAGGGAVAAVAAAAAAAVTPSQQTEAPALFTFTASRSLVKGGGVNAREESAASAHTGREGVAGGVAGGGGGGKGGGQIVSSDTKRNHSATPEGNIIRKSDVAARRKLALHRASSANSDVNGSFFAPSMNMDAREDEVNASAALLSLAGVQ